MLVPHEDVLSVALGPLRILKLHGVGKEEVLLVSADVWVNDGDQTTTSLSDLGFHSLHGILGEVDWVERKPTIVACFHCFFVCPESVLDIQPEYVHRELILGEVLATLGDHVGRNGSPLAELEAKRVDGRQGQITRRLRQVFLDDSRSLDATKHDEFEHTSLAEEIHV